jgi:RimJ/RimL family protein N-acetyltransferase
MSIEGKRVRLRAVEEGDLPLLHLWANDEELWSQLGGWRFPTSMDAVKSWFSGLKNDALNLRLIIECIEDGEAIGTANLVDIDWKNSHATHGMLLASPERRGKGYGFDTVMAVMRYAFDELQLERLETDIIEYNAPSLALYVGRCQWQEEGRLRRWHFRKGRRWDKVLVGVTRDEYADLTRSSRYWESP